MFADENYRLQIIGEVLKDQDSTKLMLSLLQELQPKVRKSVQVKNKTKMWKIIEERMAFEGYNFSSVQIENKFRGLEGQFKKRCCIIGERAATGKLVLIKVS
ncbi:PREDICTED: uncharacterized protein LOC108379576 [Rhagoletis zephyria]|uniref:uncharacterized protein LOC108379576 n=1 Tax=Rhagoletis zephyria TaxID=28612 RepID=UPI0008117A2B|nr:PREDICTED: uncharacterized protein LOC108379576 [Rhagoletis zephyria]